MSNNVFATVFNPLRRYATFRGRAGRTEFWGFNLLAILCQVAIGMTVPIIAGPVTLLLLIPAQAVLARRLHDVDKPAWWGVPMPFLIVTLFFLFAMTQLTIGDEAGGKVFAAIIVLVPVTLALGVLLLVWTCRRGTAGRNRFGESVA
jgi:uncharacterized membrane protein YhaH (DUF805 family)